MRCRYEATLHAINGGVLKLSRIGGAHTPLYRAVGTGRLPSELCVGEGGLQAAGVRALAAWGLQPATRHAKAAFAYAAQCEPAFVLEISQGLVDRAADLESRSEPRTHSLIAC